MGSADVESGDQLTKDLAYYLWYGSISSLIWAVGWAVIAAIGAIAGVPELAVVGGAVAIILAVWHYADQFWNIGGGV